MPTKTDKDVKKPRATTREEESPAPSAGWGAPAEGPLEVNDFNVRSDDDVKLLQFCRVIAGEHAGRYGVYAATSERGKDGYPTKVAVRTRDDRGETIYVDYADIRPDTPGKR